MKPSDIKYASIYDSFTITVLEQIEDLGFCEKGKGGAFVSDGNLISGVGKLPFNTDGGGPLQQPPGQPRRPDQGAGSCGVRRAVKRTRRFRFRTVIWSSPMAPVARSAPVMVLQPIILERE